WRLQRDDDRRRRPSVLHRPQAELPSRPPGRDPLPEAGERERRPRGARSEEGHRLMADTTCGPLNRTPEQRMERLRELLAAESGWTLGEAILILAGIDPGDEFDAVLRKEPEHWDLLPGLDRPCDPEAALAFDNEAKARVWNVARLHGFPG